MNPYAACCDRVQDNMARARAERIEQGAGRVALFHARVGLIETFYDQGWWVQGGHTKIRAWDKSGAERLADRWAETGNCPAPASARITPKRQARAV